MTAPTLERNPAAAGNYADHRAYLVRWVARHGHDAADDLLGRQRSQIDTLRLTAALTDDAGHRAALEWQAQRLEASAHALAGVLGHRYAYDAGDDAAGWLTAYHVAADDRFPLLTVQTRYGTPAVRIIREDPLQ